MNSISGSIPIKYNIHPCRCKSVTRHEFCDLPAAGFPRARGAPPASRCPNDQGIPGPVGTGRPATSPCSLPGRGRCAVFRDHRPRNPATTRTRQKPWRKRKEKTKNQMNENNSPWTVNKVSTWNITTLELYIQEAGLSHFTFPTCIWFVPSSAAITALLCKTGLKLAISTKAASLWKRQSLESWVLQ